jgi:hypothetical protein
MQGYNIVAGLVYDKINSMSLFTPAGVPVHPLDSKGTPVYFRPRENGHLYVPDDEFRSGKFALFCVTGGISDVAPPVITAADLGTEIIDGAVTWLVDSWYQDKFGWLGEGVATNKVTCRKQNPIDTTNITDSTVDTVTSVVPITMPEQLANVCTLGNVYQTVGSGVAGGLVSIEGATGNILPHSFTVWAKKISGIGSSRVGLSNTFLGAVTITADWQELTSDNITPSNEFNALKVSVDTGDTVQWILPCLEESPHATSLKLDPTDPLTAVTRAATVSKWPTTSKIRSNNIALQGTVIPEGSGQIGNYLFSANTGTHLESRGTGIKFTKAGLSVENLLDDTAGLVYQWQVYLDSVTGFGVRSRHNIGGLWSTWTLWSENPDVTDAIIDSLFEIGSLTGADQFDGNYPMFHSKYTTSPKTYLEAIGAPST